MAVDKDFSLRDFWRLARLREQDGHMSSLRQLVEAFVLRTFYGIGPGYYQMAGFWNKSVSWHDKVRHLSVGEYRKRLAILNPLNYRKLSQHKLAEKAMLGILSIPTPEFLGYYHGSFGRTVDNAPLVDAGSLDRFLAARVDLDKVCFKTVEGWGGHGFELIQLARGNSGGGLLRSRTGEHMDTAQFCSDVLNQAAGASGWVLEKFLVQHEQLSKLNPSSLNTLRVWALQYDTDVAKPLLAFLRIGRAGSIVDNRSSGGIVVPVDIRTGTLKAAFEGTPRRQAFPVHPDHGAQIEGIQIPFFAEALRLAADSVLAFPGIRFAGVDVAISPSGPSIIELNTSPERTGAAFVEVPTRDLLCASKFVSNF
jgi:hypothetical protein